MATPTGPDKNPLGEHRLAAIVFTDVANFSGQVEQNETRTLMLVQRDLKLISDICQSFGGDVLKNTGDGCLAAFASVEDAVGSAIKIQRVIADARHRLPPEEILHHRIGIHLGDVFFGHGDVLGNGVNIAARLLGEAEPDGICVSQTVYDLVKHGMDVKAVCIGARELKHISEAVQVYRLLVDAVAESQQIPAPTKPPPPRSRLVAAGSVLFALAIISTAAWYAAKSGKPRASTAVATTHPTPTPTSSPAPSVAPIVQATPKATPPIASNEPANLPAVLQILQRKPDFAFDTNAAWHRFRTISNDSLTTAVNDKTYVMTVASSAFRVYLSTAPLSSFGDVTIQASGRVHGAEPSSWGVQLLNTQGTRKVVRAMIASRGTLRVDLTRLTGSDATNNPLNPKDFYLYHDPAIHPGEQTNRLTLDVHDHQLRTFVNGQKFGTTWDLTSLGSAEIVLIVEGGKGASAEFDELKVWIPHPAGLHPTSSPAHP